MFYGTYVSTHWYAYENWTIWVYQQPIEKQNQQKLNQQICYSSDNYSTRNELQKRLSK